MQHGVQCKGSRLEQQARLRCWCRVAGLLTLGWAALAPWRVLLCRLAAATLVAISRSPAVSSSAPLAHERSEQESASCQLQRQHHEPTSSQLLA